MTDIFTDNRKTQLQVAVTGGIGSGKSTVCKIIESFGFPVYYADERAKWLTTNNPQILSEIRSLFGDSVFEGNTLLREQLGNIVFGDSAKLAQLNAIIHPVVKADYENWVNSQTISLVFSEIAILFETGRDTAFDQVIMVNASQEVRLERVMKRNNFTKEEVLTRMNNQLPEEEKANRSHHIIHNNGEESLVTQVEEVLKKLASKVMG